MMPPISAAMQRTIISRKSLVAAVLLVSDGVIAVIKSRLTVCRLLCCCAAVATPD